MQRVARRRARCADPRTTGRARPEDGRADDGAMRTEFAFELPRGYVGADGTVHRRGVMRLATARDELLPLYDARVQENPAFTTVVLLGRVITSLGSLGRSTAR